MRRPVQLGWFNRGLSLRLRGLSRAQYWRKWYPMFFLWDHQKWIKVINVRVNMINYLFHIIDEPSSSSLTNWANQAYMPKKQFQTSWCWILLAKQHINFRNYMEIKFGNPVQLTQSINMQNCMWKALKFKNENNVIL